MKKLLLTTLFVPFSFILFAQTSSKIEIKGTVQDTSKTLLPSASVLLLLPQDSTLVAYTLTDTKGQFSFKNVKRQPYLVKATFVSYLPHQELISLSDDATTDLGIIELKPIIKELYEVVVKTAKAPISIKGDTVEYDASKFKVPPGSTVEDLLRKLPGIEVLQDGSIMAQGEQVRRVTVDGKRFFSDDPKMATKNLGADAINKVQVFNDKSEQSKLTGVEDGQHEKTVNLELKEEARKGGFGKATAGVGTENRTSISGNYNKFDAKNQLAIIGFGNNTNQSGMSWDDYQDFRGSNAFNWGDDADFGFSSDGMFRYFLFGDEDESFSLPISNDNGNGYSTNYAGGINYNYDHKKNQFSANYFYNHSKLQLDSYNRSQQFLDNNLSFLSEGNTNQFDLRGNHKVTIRGQKELDSLNTVTIIGNGRLNNQNQTFSNLSDSYSNSALINNSLQENKLDRFSYAGVVSAIYRKKFKKEKGKSFAVSGTYNASAYDNEGIQKATNEFFQATDVNESLKKLNQLNDISGISNQYKSSILFVEPFSKKFFWETFYNISLQQHTVDRTIADRNEDSGSNTRNDLLSRYYENTILYNRLGSSIRYSNKGINITGGLAALQYNLDGTITTTANGRVLGNVDKTFQAITPFTQTMLTLKNNRYLNFNYSIGVRPPSINDLQPIIDNRNPLYLREGNPDLLPEKQHSVRVFYNQYNPVSFVNMYSSIQYSYNINQIVYNLTTNPTTLASYSKPTNISGGQNVMGYFGFGFPLKKTKATMNLGANVNYMNSLSFINEVLNTTNSMNYNFEVRLGLTPVDWFSLYTNTRWGIGNTKYSINTNQNQQILNHEYRGEMTVQFPKNIYWITNLNYQVYKNERLGFDQNVPILNMSVHKQFGKKNQWETRLAAYDIFKRNLGISQTVFQNYVSYNETKTLSRYFMLKLTYNMRGNTTKLRKDWF